jgi:hypothetical protein
MAFSLIFIKEKGWLMDSGYSKNAKGVPILGN